MGIQKSEAVVLKIRDFRESSLILNLFTKDFGKLSGLIKGIRKDPQRYGGLPLVFSRTSVVFYDGPKRNINLVTQCDAQDQFQSIRADLTKSNYANYFVELLDTVTQDYDKNERLFELMINSLSSLCENLDCRQVARIFEIRLLKLSGFQPRLDACVNCQKKISAQGRFSLTLGGMLCPLCFALSPEAQVVSQGSLASIDYIEKSTWQKAMQLKMHSYIAGELAAVLGRFLDIHLDKEIKSRKFLN